ncbi:MAG: sigma-70 family RNA polymerase sigma factor [Bacteroidota bacterium]
MEDNYQEAYDYALSEDEVIHKMSYDDLLKLVRTLPPAYQTVFNLYAIEGYNHREIAEMLDISEGTSKSNLAKARMKLQIKIKELLGDKTYPRYV